MNKQSTANTVASEVTAQLRYHSQAGTGFYSTLTHLILKQKRQRLALAK
ncbi:MULTISPECIES: hypothetical protein [unclassified Oceanobacter]|jgi:hypothetical protein|nr:MULTISPECIES: hypothetical protein [unclassified Oceanobacter]MDP2506322.1 hypothetical protein [Oceanobacter sp. 3_MG-2023]MDP2546417.1 hypothetical protein [Oceanobacter sp. 4_MG-2023]MDP2609982.1 hypothetical protein [Oceanobacter sp. 1_MG-2023]MDP2613252.1 hypothetical protein [Oceanobacter sp. 2_MG-2023]